MFDINGSEFLILLVIAVIVIGPERLPRYAEQLARLVKRARVFIQDAKTRVDDELGEDIKGVDWAALDPRKYDPRRIVRDALLDDLMPPATGVTRADVARSADPRVDDVISAPAAGAETPFDDEAT